MLPRNKLFLSFFFVSLYSIAVETYLTRYFAVSNWAEYGYWVISIVMAGFAISGIALSLFENLFERHSKTLVSVIPVFLILFTALGLYFVSINDFNPLAVQNDELWKAQLFNVFLYYAALLPVFVCLGLYIGLIYVINFKDISKIYAVNLVASAIGSVSVLIAMYVVDLFHLMTVAAPLLLIPLFFSIVDQNRKRTRAILVAGLVIFAGAEFYFYSVGSGIFAKAPANSADASSTVVGDALPEGDVPQDNPADEPAAVSHGKNAADINVVASRFPLFKPITPVLQFKGNRIDMLESNPEGYFLILDNMGEKNGIDLSNNYGLLKMGPPPSSYGLYRDGRRVCALMNSIPSDFSYLNGTLDALPYKIRTKPSVLLAGTNGGFRPLERQHLGVSSLVALESDNMIYDLVKTRAYEKNGIKYSDGGFSFEKNTPYGYLMRSDRKFDIIDISSEFMGSSENNKYTFTIDAVEVYLAHLNQGGIISIPVTIGEFSVYSAKMVETARRALVASGVEHPEKNIILYRSNWTVRVLVSNKPFSAADIDVTKKFCAERSFDTSYFPGIDPEKISVWNGLDAVSFDNATYQASDKMSDAVMNDAIKILGDAKEREKFVSTHFFNIEPATIDRPSFFSVLRLPKTAQILQKRSVLPLEQIGFLVNVAVLVQAVLLALVILLLPLVRLRAISSAKSSIPKIMVYFACLGLGFLFIEMGLIERFSLFLGSATASFSIVLAGMLIFSGAGSYYSSRFMQNPSKGVMRAVGLIAVSVLLYIIFLFPLIQVAGGLPFIVKTLIVLAVIAPVSFALGMPFPLGLSSLREHTGALLPWAWAINGAFSVISTPLANIISVSGGFTVMFIIAIGLYALAFVAFPVRKKTA